MHDAIASLMVKLVDKFDLVKELETFTQKLQEIPSNQHYPTSKEIEEMLKMAISGAMEKQPSNATIILGIDALDECKIDSVTQLTELISNIITDGQPFIKFLACSRPGVGQSVFQRLLSDKALKHLDMTQISNDDLRLYIEEKMEEVQRRNPKYKLNDRQLWDQKVAEMVDSAQGLFKWVKTAFGKFDYGMRFAKITNIE